jgi:hypothetical protein
VERRDSLALTAKRIDEERDTFWGLVFKGEVQSNQNFRRSKRG